MIVDFMIIGAQKCGTTTLFSVLDQHEDLVGCTDKEPHFFSTEPDWRAALPRYHSLFPSDKEGMRFEASTSYTFSPHRNPMIWDDLHAYNPRMKLIYLVRRPIDRMVSGYMHDVQRGYTRGTLEREIVRNPLYLNITRYASQLRPFIRTFGRDRVLVIDFDDLISRRDEVLASVADFLGVDPAGFEAVGSVHANRTLGAGGKRHHRFDDPSLPLRALRRFAPPVYRALETRSRTTFGKRPEVSEKLQKALLELLDVEIGGVERLMGKELNHWREPVLR